MWRFFGLLVAGVIATPVRSSPGLSVSLAAADARKQQSAKTYRYLSLYNLTREQRVDFLLVLAFVVNSLSAEAEIVRPVLVAPDLVRIDTTDYGDTFAAAWEKLAKVDPYYHAQLVKTVIDVKTETVTETEQWGHWRRKSDNAIVKKVVADADPASHYFQLAETRPVKKEVRKEKERQETITSAGPWLPPTEVAALSLVTGSEVPIVRADWFVYWVGRQEDRGEAGYYDFLGVKNRADAEKLAGLDRKLAATRRKEIAAIVSESGVAINNRQIYWLGTVGGVWWETRDSKKSTAQNNAVSLLNGDHKHDAEEIYFGLPNNLFGYLASDAQGVLQKSVPTDIAGDRLSTNNDPRIHPSASCVGCHAEGLRPIDDWARSVYQGPENPGSPIILAAVDPKKLKRLRQLYLTPLKRQLQRDVQTYADALLLTNGLTPERNSTAYVREKARYEASLGPDEVAAELGVRKEVWQKALKVYVAPQGVPVITDPVILGMLGGRKVRREHLEERYGLMQEILARGK